MLYSSRFRPMPPKLSDRPTGWARTWAAARPYARPTPRAGAWYPVFGDADDDRVVLEVRGRRVAVHRRLLEIRPDRPATFTVVVRSRDSFPAMALTAVDRVYAVCPHCTNRIRILENQPAAHCRECGHGGDVAWWETG